MKLRFNACLLFVICISFCAIGQQSIKQKVPTVIQSPSKALQSEPKAGANANSGITPKSKNGNIVLNWTKPISEQFKDDEQAIKFLSFKGALFDSKFHGLPEYSQRFKMNPGMNNIIISLVNPVYVPLSANESEVINSNHDIKADVRLDYSVVYDHSDAYAYLSFVPLRKNPSNNGYEKLVSFSLEVKQNYEPNAKIDSKRAASGLFASNSVLASGKWYKIGLSKDGVYKLDYNFFKKLGLNMNSLAPKNIRIYGNGGYMLPDSNSAARADDLVENAIYVHGQNDTSFSKKDYVLFYGQGPTKWTYSSCDNHFHHQVNLYSDTTYYFVNTDLGPGKRIGGEMASGPVTDTVTAFDDYAYHEADETNLIQSGYEWFGEYFDAVTSYIFSFNFPNIVVSTPGFINTVIASRYDYSSYYSINVSSSTFIDRIDSVATSCYYCSYAASAGGTCSGAGSGSFTPTGPQVDVTINKITAGAIGWLYYLEVNVRRQLDMVGDQMEFRDMKSVSPGNTSLFKINSLSPALKIWDISNPQQIDSVSLINNSGTYRFSLPTTTLKQFISFTGNSYDSVTYFVTVQNQNLHAMPQADLVIVTCPDFINYAEQLADFHRSHDGLGVNVVTTQQVYNEFSSGRQDPVAIRDYMRMLYARATNYATSPKYLLLFGDGSFDPKHRISKNTNYVLAYESPESFTPTASFVSDDFYALLKNNYSDLTTGSFALDIAVGRFPADNGGDAQTMVSKVKEYETGSGEPANTTTSCCNQQVQYNLGNWRNQICFIAHDGDGGIHESEADNEATIVNAAYPNFNISKIYCDAYQELQTPGGPRYPEVNTSIDNQMNQGLLIINYTGHGGPLGLALQRILGFSDIYSWTNSSKLSLFFTASCSFAPFDNPYQISAGELCVTLQSGGNIALMTTTRETFSGDNTALNNSFYSYLYSRLPDGSLPRIGDLFVNSKNTVGAQVTNCLMFTLLGDPAVRLAYPEERVYTSTINSKPAAGPVDTIKALSKVTITGYVGDTLGNPLNNFNGVLYPTIYDKPDSITTLDNPSITGNIFFHFAVQNSILYKGRISVINGKFSFTFVVPKDINYNYGFGKISYYAQNGTIDATGNFKNINIGGTLNNVINNGKGPQVRLFINDSNFVYDGMTNENPQVFAILFDSNGINTTGNGIGHNVTAVLDNNTQNTYDLTNYFQPSLNSYQKGTITYPFTSLSPGKHSLSLRVWNVFDNSTQATTEFNVESQSNLQLNHVLNYPNPFTTHTQFYFEINEVCDQMDVQIQIFTVAGKLVKNIVTTVKTDSFRSQPVDWDGRDDFGDKIANGVYIYHVKVRTSDGTVADTYQKLVIL
jgi:hypothetical protein